MLTLALEFSTSRRSVALLKDRPEKARPDVLGTASDEGARSVKPLGLITRVLREAGIRRDDIERVAVGLGPGSYTGVRSSIALAQGWQLARGIKLVGVSTAACLAFQAQVRGWFGQVTVVIDAQRNELYLASYHLSQDRRELVQPLRLIGMGELAAHSAPGSMLVGPDIAKWALQGQTLFPEAWALGSLADEQGASVAGENLEPIYLRETSFVKAPPARRLPES